MRHDPPRQHASRDASRTRRDQHRCWSRRSRLHPHHPSSAVRPMVNVWLPPNLAARANTAGPGPAVADPGPAWPERRTAASRSRNPGRASGRGHAAVAVAVSASSSAGLSATRVSVVSSSAAIDAAFATAERVTLTGSTTPAAMRSPYSPVAAFEPGADGQVRDLRRHDRALEPGVDRRSGAAGSLSELRTMPHTGELVARRGRGRRRAPWRRGPARSRRRRRCPPRSPRG